MEYGFDASHEKYIEATASGVIRPTDLIAAVSELMQHPDYSHKHSLWVFSNFSLGIDTDGLKEVVNAFRSYKPKTTEFANKSALVVSAPTYKAIIDIFVTIASGLPFEYRSFTDKKKAIAFLCSE